jgi:hypothetical protein
MSSKQTVFRAKLSETKESYIREEPNISRVHSLSAILKNVDSNTRTLRGSAVNSISKGQLNTQYNFALEKVTVT